MKNTFPSPKEIDKWEVQSLLDLQDSVIDALAEMAEKRERTLRGNIRDILEEAAAAWIVTKEMSKE